MSSTFCYAIIAVLAIVAFWAEDYCFRSFSFVVLWDSSLAEFSWVREIARKLVYVALGFVLCLLYLRTNLIAIALSVTLFALSAPLLLSLTWVVREWYDRVRFRLEKRHYEKSKFAEAAK